MQKQVEALKAHGVPGFLHNLFVTGPPWLKDSKPGYSSYFHKCVPSTIKYGAERLRMAAELAGRYSSEHLPDRYWFGLQMILRDIEGVERSIENGVYPRFYDIIGALWGLHRAEKLHGEIVKRLDEDLANDAIEPDVAHRIAEAWSKLHADAEFVYASAFHCKEFPDNTAINPRHFLEGSKFL
mmetsp:Transcript_70649/g.196526  ORF Transcript_70649/g.196526 Transcript_70649/m.196526 type:complete len:183 (-) Transcript_70649:102-650(-)